MKRTFALLAVLLLAAAAGFAQTTDSHLINFNLTEGALIDLSDASDLDFSLTLSALPADAGLAPTGGPYTATRYLYYTALANVADFQIAAALDSALPAGLTLQLAATEATGGGGNPGAGQTIAAVDNTADPLVTGIGSCYTTRGATATSVDYTLTMSNYTGASISRTLTYTISGW